MIHIKKLFPKRKSFSHKGDYGKVFIHAGSSGMLGASILASRGALRVGAGLVYLITPKASRDIINTATPEVIAVGGDCVADFKEAIAKADALAIGPGLGERRKIAYDLLLKLGAEGCKRPIILDADGLIAFADDLNSLKNLKLNLIITPHSGELGRLLSKSVEEIQKNRDKIAGETARSLGCILVLKGNQTVIADKSGKIYINKTGNPGMATAGVGDVLTGVIAGLAAQGINPLEAAIAGVYIHGLAGDLASKEKGEYGMIASDLVEKIPMAIMRAQNK